MFLEIFTCSPDTAVMYALLNHYKTQYLQADETLDADWVHYLATNQPIWHINHQKQLVGIIWWEALEPGHHAVIHLVLEPKYIKAFWRQHLDIALLNQAQSQWQLQRVYARFDPTRQQPVKWLKRAGFRPFGLDEDGQAIWHYDFSCQSGHQ